MKSVEQLLEQNGFYAAAIHGISASVDAQKVPQAAVMPLLLRVLDATAELAGGGEKTADGWQISGEWDGTAYILVSDPQTGDLISVSVPSIPLTVRFSDFRPLTE